MCGIAGACSFNGPVFDGTDHLVAFAEPLKYRGPDAEGYLNQKEQQAFLSLAHRRLSIIDLSSEANQPMESLSGRSVITFNGEIYNYQELRKDLLDSGKQFRTRSDTEVLLVAYEHWGIETLLDRIEGMFALALFDRSEQALYLAKDPFGKKPLHYYLGEDRLIFSSDIRSFNHLQLDLTLDLTALGYFFSEQATPGTHTIWKQIKKLEAGSWARFSKNDGFEEHAYWSMTFGQESHTNSLEEIVSETDDLIGKAIKKRLVADVNVAAQLSGGVDSSLVVAKMAMASSKPINTYSVGFKDAEYNELPWAKQVAEKYGTDHTELMVGPSDLDSVSALVAEFGEPFADVSMIPSYLIAKEISRTEKVVLGGDGGDELFAGYYSYYFTDKLRKIRPFRHLSPIVNKLEKIVPTYHTQLVAKLMRAAHQPNHELLNRNMGFQERELKKLFPGREMEVLHGAVSEIHREVWPESDGLLSSVLTASIRTRLLNDYLVKVDRSTMYASVEMRSPLLDKRLAEFVSGIPESQFMKPYGVKSILKCVAERYLPHDLVHRNKMGFGVPASTWLAHDLDKNWEEVVLGGKQKLIDMDYDFVRQIFEESKKQDLGVDQRLWILYVFHLWAQNV